MPRLLTAMHRRLRMRRHDPTTRRTLGTMLPAWPTDRVPTMVGTRATTVAGIIVRVATRIRDGRRTHPAKKLKGVRKGGRPAREDALKLREQILGVATQLFLEHGYGSTSIEAVAAHAGVSKRTFYDRFEDKAALFAA